MFSKREIILFVFLKSLYVTVQNFTEKYSSSIIINGILKELCHYNKYEKIGYNRNLIESLFIVISLYLFLRVQNINN